LREKRERLFMAPGRNAIAVFCNDAPSSISCRTIVLR
jgi:hypothetical protein